MSKGEIRERRWKKRGDSEPTGPSRARTLYPGSFTLHAAPSRSSAVSWSRGAGVIAGMPLAPAAPSSSIGVASSAAGLAAPHPRADALALQAADALRRALSLA